ncbi:MAG: peroxiredoxin family protein [Blastocatellia bacterium]|nr:peroxiredoxin family protein [Blastocatellia bacterium]
MLTGTDQVQLLAISVDTPKQSQELVAKIASDGKGPITFPILSDPKHAVIDAYGIRNPKFNGEDGEGIPYPTVCVINKKGEVTWLVIEEDYKKRPSNEEIRTALKLSGGK